MTHMNAKELNAEANALASHFAIREIHPEQIVALCAAAVGEVLGRNRQAGILDDSMTEAMLQTCFREMRTVAFAGTDQRN